MSRRIPLLAALVTTLLVSSLASATIVRFETAMGSFDVNLYDRGTPATVANFLAYVNSGAYRNTIVHRSVQGFVVQGGGFTYQGTPALGNVTQNAAVTNEPVYSNVRGTIAMAKLGNSPNSATNQWFINVGNNSANLDTQNGGFTAFGQVIGNGMAVIDAINLLTNFQISAAIDSIPLRNYTPANAAAGLPITDQHLVIATSVIVLDSSADSAASLTKPANTLITPTPAPTPTTPAPQNSGGGGAISIVSLLLLGALKMRLRRGVAAAAT
jgi:peptidyl-prolyl cis-trans isomerase A (cyclophilin A)